MLEMLTEGMLITNRKTNPEEFYSLSYRAALIAEKTAINFRNISEKSVAMKRHKLMANTIQNLGIKVTGDNNKVKILIPKILPHKKAKNNDFLIEPLLYALEQFVFQNDFTKFSNCVLWIKHIYQDVSADKAIRDYDNFELSEIIDCIALHLMIDDSGQYMSMYNTTEISDETYTEINVMTKEEFAFLLSVKNN